MISRDVEISIAGGGEERRLFVLISWSPIIIFVIMHSLF